MSDVNELHWVTYVGDAETGLTAVTEVWRGRPLEAGSALVAAFEEESDGKGYIEQAKRFTELERDLKTRKMWYRGAVKEINQHRAQIVTLAAELESSRSYRVKLQTRITALENLLTTAGHRKSADGTCWVPPLNQVAARLQGELTDLAEANTKLTAEREAISGLVPRSADNTLVQDVEATNTYAQALRAQVKRLTAERNQLKTDLATTRFVSDDIEKTMREAHEVTSARLQAAGAALVGTGYFKEDEVDDDVAPRIIEMHSKLADLETSDANYRATLETEVGRLTSERDETLIERNEARAARDDVIRQVTRLTTKNSGLLESLEQALSAMRKFGKEGDDYGGPHLSECIEELGKERDEARTALKVYDDRHTEDEEALREVERDNDRLEGEVKRLRDVAEQTLPYLAQHHLADGTTADHALRHALNAEDPSP